MKHKYYMVSIGGGTRNEILLQYGNYRSGNGLTEGVLRNTVLGMA